MMVPVMQPLLRFLGMAVKGKRVVREDGFALEPLYLNDLALKVPDAAIEVLLKETGHLLDNVTEVVVHGLNLHRRDIRSDRDLEAIVSRSTRILEIDVLNNYYGGVKHIYGAIIDYSTRVPQTTGNLSEQQMSALQHIRLVCRSAAEIIKLTAYLRDNVNRYIGSENKQMRDQYNRIRYSLAMIMRRIYKMPWDKGYVRISA